MLSLLIWPKVITLCGFLCILNYKYSFLIKKIAFFSTGKSGRESCASQVVDPDRRISCSEAIGLTEMNRLRVPGIGSGLGDIAGACDAAESKLSKGEFRRSLRRINSLTRFSLISPIFYEQLFCMKVIYARIFFVLEVWLFSFLMQEH
jgi:hypothetical protein